jgi:signal transduction histidine kinase
LRQNDAGPDALRVQLDEERLWLLLEAGRALVSELDVDSVLRGFLDTARELTGARYAAIGVLDEKRRSLERFVTSGIEPAVAEAIGDPPHGRGILGLLIDDPRPLRLHDVTRHPRSYGFPLNHPPMHSFLGVPVTIRGRAWGNLYLTEKSGGDFDEADEQACLVLAGWAATAIEIARVYQAERERRGELEQAVQRLEATREIAEAVGGETRLVPVLELIVKRARALVDAAGMLILLQEGGELVVTTIAGDVDPGLLGTRVPIEGSASGAVLRGRRPERLADVRSRLRFALAEAIEARAGLLVPLVFHGRPLGVLEAFDRLTDGPEFSADDERLLQAFAASAATAVATAQDVARQSLRRGIEAAERERSRWARELHDETLQELAALKISLTTALRASQDEARLQTIRDSISRIEIAIEALRAIIGDLRPAALDALGPAAALESLAERVRGRTGLEVDLRVQLASGDGSSPARHTDAVESTVYRVVQEALNNVAKHADASRASVTVTELDDEIRIEVADDGRGFDVRDHTEGFGLAGMRERVGLAGGTFGIESRPDGGTALTITVPADRVAPG